MIIYKQTKCKCGCEITLEFDGTEYRGFCPICEKEITEKAYGDEQRIQDKYGR